MINIHTIRKLGSDDGVVLKRALLLPIKRAIRSQRKAWNATRLRKL